MAAIPVGSLVPPVLRSCSNSIEEFNEEEFEECNDLTVLDYGNVLERRNHWMTPHYLSLQLRCSRLMMNEAQRALRHHFRRESSEKLEKLLAVGRNTEQEKDNFGCLQENENAVEGYSVLPTFLAVPIDESTGLLKESFRLNW